MKKRLFAIMCAVMLSAALLSTNAFATANNEWSELLGESGRTYCGEAGHNNPDPDYDVVRIFASQSEVELPSVSYVEFIDIIAETTNGDYVNVSEWARASVNNETITYDRGRIDAIAAGNATVTVLYGGKSCSFIANVLSNENAALSSLDSGMQTYDLAAGAVLSRARACLNYTWSPTQDLIRWRSNGYYYAGSTQTGLPYTQAYQCYPETIAPVVTTGFSGSFASKMSSSDFYSSYQFSGGYYGPRYGLDCSGFLSLCMGAARRNTNQIMGQIYAGTYAPVGWNISDFISGNNDWCLTTGLTDAKRNTLMAAYDDMLGSHDGLVNNGHCMLVISTNDSAQTVTVIEQTTYYTKSSVWSFSTLANSNYLPYRFL